jgi:hypothetical protein
MRRCRTAKGRFRKCGGGLGGVKRTAKKAKCLKRGRHNKCLKRAKR